LARSRSAEAEAAGGSWVVVLEDLAVHGRNGYTAAKVRQWVWKLGQRGAKAARRCSFARNSWISGA